MRLLVLDKSQNHTAGLISLFRSEGHAVRAHRVESGEELLTLATDPQWDVLISDDKHPEISVDQAVNLLRKCGSDVPAILIREKITVEVYKEGLAMGVVDVIDANDTHHLVTATLREASNLDSRRKIRELSKEVEELEQRCELLLSASQEAIAYISDGMHISCNEAYARTFGFADDEDELLFQPIIDLIAPGDQNKFKNFLKGFDKNKQDANCTLAIVKADGDEEKVELQFSASNFDGEECTQITISGSSSTAAVATSAQFVNQNPESGLNSYFYFIELLGEHLKHSNGHLLFVGIEGLHDLRSNLGLSEAERSVFKFGHFIQELLKDEAKLGHYGDSTFVILLPESSVQEANTIAKGICDRLHEALFEIDGQTIQTNCCIGIAAANMGNDYRLVMDQAFSALDDLRDVGESCAVKLFTQQAKKETGSVAGMTLEDAIDLNRFRLRFQPMVSLRDAEGDHYEVLLRMLDDNSEEVSPDDFVAAFSAKEFSTKLDRWVILESFKRLSAKRQTGEDVRMMINLTANALHDDALIPWISVAIKAADLKPEFITFQFAEETVGEFLSRAKQATAKLMEHGCHVSISHFGRSEDPFRALKHIQCDYIKVDPHYTEELEQKGDPHVLSALVKSINETERLTIIPFVESASTMARLWQLNVGFIQGFYISPPVHEMDYIFSDM